MKFLALQGLLALLFCIGANGFPIAGAGVGGRGSSCASPYGLRVSMQMQTEVAAVESSFSSSRGNFDFSQVGFELPTEVEAIQEEAARLMISKLRRAQVRVPGFISDSPVPSSFAKLEAAGGSDNKLPPIVMLHGFDSSCLEFRRLAPLLASMQGGAGGRRDVYALDVLGWGFSDSSNVQDQSPRAKMAHLRAFIEQVVLPEAGTERVVLLGASLGGAIAINLAAEECPQLVDSLLLIDAQGFIDGKGPSSLPRFLAQVGVSVLKSEWLRNLANQLSYCDKAAFATNDAMLVGRLPCLMPSWQESTKSFLLSGGFTVSQNVGKVQQPTLVVWGRQDEILDKSFPGKFQSTMGEQRCRVQWMEECGHVPHLEKPQETAAAILDFLADRA
jgi:pimeloyl-ACP methyl ester carboxylesterase